MTRSKNSVRGQKKGFSLRKYLKTGCYKGNSYKDLRGCLKTLSTRLLNKRDFLEEIVDIKKNL